MDWAEMYSLIEDWVDRVDDFVSGRDCSPNATNLVLDLERTVLEEVESDHIGVAVMTFEEAVRVLGAHPQSDLCSEIWARITKRLAQMTKEARLRAQN